MLDDMVGDLEGYIPQLLGVLVVLVVLARTTHFLITRSWPWFIRFKDFMDDLIGEPERPGHDAKPGIMVRLRAAEQTQQSQGELLRAVNYQLNPNGGGSALDKLTQQITGVANEVASISELMLGHFNDAAERDNRIDTNQALLRGHEQQLGRLEGMVRTLTEQRTAYLVDRQREREELLRQIGDLRHQIASLLDRPYDDGQPKDPTQP